MGTRVPINKYFNQKAEEIILCLCGDTGVPAHKSDFFVNPPKKGQKSAFATGRIMKIIMFRNYILLDYVAVFLSSYRL